MGVSQISIERFNIGTNIRKVIIKVVYTKIGIGYNIGYYQDGTSVIRPDYSKLKLNEVYDAEEMYIHGFGSSGLCGSPNGKNQNIVAYKINFSSDNYNYQEYDIQYFTTLREYNLSCLV